MFGSGTRRNRRPFVESNFGKNMLFSLVSVAVASGVIITLIYSSIFIKAQPPTGSASTIQNNCDLYNVKLLPLVKHCLRMGNGNCTTRVPHCIEEQWSGFIPGSDKKSTYFKECMSKRSGNHCGLDACLTEACNYEEKPFTIDDTYSEVEGKNCTADVDCGCGSSYCCNEGTCQHCEYKCDDYCPWHTYKDCLFTRCRDKSCYGVDITPKPVDVEVPLAEPPKVEEVPVAAPQEPEIPPSERDVVPVPVPVAYQPVAQAQPVAAPVTPPVAPEPVAIPIAIEEEEQAAPVSAGIPDDFTVEDDPVCTKDEDCGCNDNCCVDGKCSPCKLCSDDCMYCVGEYCHDISC